MSRSTRRRRKVQPRKTKKPTQAPVPYVGGPNLFIELPDEIKFHVFGFLASSQLAKCMRVCSDWRGLVSDNYLWQRIYISRWTPTQAFLNGNSDFDWRMLYNVKLRIESNISNLSLRLDRILHQSSINDMAHCPRHTATFDSPSYGRSLLATACGNKNVHLWDMDNVNFSRTLTGQNSPVLCVSIYGKSCVSGDVDGGLVLWDLSKPPASLPWSPISGEYVHKWQRVHAGAINGVAITESKLYTCSSDGSLKNWDLTRCAFGGLFEGHKGPVNSIALHGNLLLSGSNDKTVRVWDMSTTKSCFQIELHTDTVTRVRAIDEYRIMTASLDGFVKLIDLRYVKKSEKDFYFTQPVTDFVFDGCKVIAGQRAQVGMQYLSTAFPKYADDDDSDDVMEVDDQLDSILNEKSPVVKGRSVVQNCAGVNCMFMHGNILYFGDNSGVTLWDFS